MGRKVRSQLRKQIEELDGLIGGEAVNPRYLHRMIKSTQTLITESGQELDESEVSRYQRTIEAAADKLDDLVSASSESSG